jgi:hypothetical protein
MLLKESHHAFIGFSQQDRAEKTRDRHPGKLLAGFVDVAANRVVSLQANACIFQQLHEMIYPGGLLSHLLGSLRKILAGQIPVAHLGTQLAQFRTSVLGGKGVEPCDV